ncbi:NAD(P)-dependent alcohol dehydrogenase [Rhodococcus sp. NPDC059968]|uniref:zinc-dependent alcohol dehydrogenase family protein n=1 Tax=Rhodococcus sp. NPDC059968 TaxID=3347017 RepID=UPI00366A64EA
MTDKRVAKGFVLTEIGYDGLVEIEREVPSVGTTQILVEMKAASLNFRDLKILKGVYAVKPNLPIVPLSDGSAQVIETGVEVSRFKAGDRVLPIYMEGWYSGPATKDRRGWKAKSADVDGTAIQYAVYDQEDILPIPASLSYEEAACLPCAGATAWQALVYVGQVKTGDTVLIMGSGGVSVLGLQIALMSGARVIATSSDDAKLQRLIDMGASDGINYKKNSNWEEEVLRLTNGRGVDLVLDVVGAATIGQSMRATKDGGYVGSVGNLSGEFSSAAATEREIRVATIPVGSREMTEDLMRALDLHNVKPVIDRRFPFKQLREALQYLEKGQHFGKVVISF